jgi:hypothetical protein
MLSDVIRHAILVTLKEGDILPGFTTALKSVLEQKELFPLWAGSTYEGRRAESLPEEVKKGFEELELSVVAATTFIDIISKNLDEAALNELLERVRAEGINLVDEAGSPEAGSAMHYFGLRGEYGWFPLYGANWPT